MNKCTDYGDIGEDTLNVTTKRRTRNIHCDTYTHIVAHARADTH